MLKFDILRVEKLTFLNQEEKELLKGMKCRQ